MPLDSDAVLLGGQNRSGTTLLSVVLDAHPDLVVGPELDFTEPSDLGPLIGQAIEMLAASDPRVLGPGTDTADPFWYDSAHFVKQCRRFGLSLGDVANAVTSVMAELGTDLTDLEDRCVLVDRLGNLRRERLGVKRWGMKLQRRIRYVDTYAEIWPNAKFLHIVRDGRDLAASHLHSVPEWGFKTIHEAATQWLYIVSRPHTVVPAGRYLEIRYEDLVTDPPGAITRMTEFLGVPFDPAMLRHAEFEHSLFQCPWAHPAAEAAAKPIAPDRIGRHKRDLTAAQIAEFEAIAGAELERLGYFG